VKRRCICFRGSWEQPPETDPNCPTHGYDEDTGESFSHDPYDGPDYDDDDVPDYRYPF